MGMGLGKSAVTLHAFDLLRRAERTTGALIVAPKRVARLTWPNEVEKWDNFRHLRIAGLHTPEGKAALEAGSADLYVTNFERLPELQDYFHGRRGAWAFDTLIIDELSKVKNPSSKRIKGGAAFCLRDVDTNRMVENDKLLRWAKHADRDVADMGLLRDVLGVGLGKTHEKGLYHYLHKVPRRWGLTGTPMSEHLLDLYGQIFLLDDGRRLGRTKSAFEEKWFYRPLRRTALGTVEPSRFELLPKEGAEEEIVAALSDICLSLRSSDYLESPPPRTTDHGLTLPAKARKDYETMERELLLELALGNVESPTAAVLSNKLLQITGGAVYITDDPEGRFAELHDAKLAALEDIRKARKGEPLIVFTAFRHERQRVLRRFPDFAPWSDRLFDDWNAGKVPGVVADPRSIGHGLNLQHGGKTVVWFTLPWSRDLYDQSNARLYRRGQTQEVEVVRILAQDTMDDAVVEALDTKGSRQDSFLQALHNLQLLRS